MEFKVTLDWVLVAVEASVITVTKISTTCELKQTVPQQFAWFSVDVFPGRSASDFSAKVAQRETAAHD